VLAPISARERGSKKIVKAIDGHQLPSGGRVPTHAREPRENLSPMRPVAGVLLESMILESCQYPTRVKI
jgi:hypothetical protein